MGPGGMDQFEYRGKKLVVWSESGVVLSASKHSVTNVGSYGGGGWVGPQGGTVAAPTIVSTTTTKQEIWIRLDDGQEKAIKLSGLDVSVREGQRVTFIAAKPERAEIGFWVTLVNHAANEQRQLTNLKEIDRKGKLGGNPVWRWTDLIIAFVFWRVSAPILQEVMPRGANFTDLMISLIVLSALPLLFVVMRYRQRRQSRAALFGNLNAWIERNVSIARSAARATAGTGTLAAKTA